MIEICTPDGLDYLISNLLWMQAAQVLWLLTLFIASLHCAFTIYSVYATVGNAVQAENRISLSI